MKAPLNDLVNGWLRTLAWHPARVLGLFFGLLSAWLFRDAALFGDDTLFLERFVPTMSSWQETWDLPPRLREWFGAMHRPLSLASWRLDNLVFGTDWRGHHLHQAGWYGAAVAAFVAMCSQVMMLLGPELRPKRRLQSLWALGFLFAVHPIHVETAAWIATRHDVIFGALLCMAIYAGAKSLRQSNRLSALRWALLTALFGGLAVQAKESGFVWLPLLAFMVLQVHWRGDLSSWRRGGLVLAPSCLVFVLALWFRQHSGISPMHQWHPDAFARWLSACGWAMDSTILPLVPRLVYEPHPPAASGWLALALAAVWLGVGWKRRHHDGLILFGLAFAGATLAPTWLVAWQPMMDSIVADRYLFLPVGGILLALSRMLSVRRFAVRVVIATAALIWVAISLPYSLAWSDGGAALGEHTVRHAPTNLEARIGGVARALRAGDVIGARRIFEIEPPAQARDDHPGHTERLAMLMAVGEQRWEDALAAAEVVALSAPGDASRWYDLGAVRWQWFLSSAEASSVNAAPRTLLVSAEAAFSRALQLDPRHFRAHLLIGHVQASLGQMEKAANSFRACIRWGGNSAEAIKAQAGLSQL